MEAKFRAARQNRIFQDVVEQIEEAIIDGRLRVGEKLPAERELKEMLQTSRSTLREALRVLEHKGLIEIKLGMGGGAVVKAVSADQVTESLDLLIRFQKVSLTHLAEFRERVEGDVVVLATKRAEPADIDALERRLQEAGDFVDRGIDGVTDFLAADKSLHLIFARMTGNPIYISILKSIHDNIHRYFEKYLHMEEPEMQENFRDLQHLVQAVSEKDTERARRLAVQHVRRFNKYMHQAEHEKRGSC